MSYHDFPCEFEGVSRLDFNITIVPRFQGDGFFYQHFRVYFGGIVLCAAHIGVSLFTVDYDTLNGAGLALLNLG